MHNGNAAMDEGVTSPTLYPASVNSVSYSFKIGRAIAMARTSIRFGSFTWTE